MPDPTLPPEVYQGMGWPQGDPSMASPAASLPGAPNFGGLPPSIPQGMGWAPPPPPEGAILPQAPAIPSTLPSERGRLPAVPSGGPLDYPVPASAFGQGPGAAPPPNRPQPAARPPAVPARPQTFGQQMQDLQNREAGTEQAQTAAIQAGVEAQKPLHEAQTAAYEQAAATTAANDEARKAENDAYKKIFATNTAAVAADRAKVESWKFNQNKYLDDLGVGGKVRWGIGMILAGIGQGMMRQGGPNPVLEMLQGNIHEANVAQYKQRDALVEQLGFDRQTGLDAAQYHAMRQAEIDKADGLAFTLLGKRLELAAVKSADPIAQANGLKEAANVRQMGDERLKSYIQLRSQHDLQTQQNAIAGGHLALAQRQFDWTKQKDQQELDLKAAALAAKGAGKLSEEESKRAIFIPGPDGKPIPATRQDGTVVLAAEPADAAKIRRQVASTSTYNTLVGQMVRGMTDHGGESGWFKSKDWQHMMSDYKAAVAELHEAYGVQSFREPTIEFFDKMTSAGVDPTSFVYDATHGLLESNRNIQTKMNGLLAGQGYDKEPIRWQDTTSPPVPTQTDEDRVLSDALRNPISLLKDRPGKFDIEFGMPRESSGPGASASGDAQRLAAQVAKAGGIMPSIRQTMETWGAALNSPDMAIRRHYSEKLYKIAEESESPETAALAKQLIDRAREQSINTVPGTGENVRGASGAPRSP
jgi:hypothetical protein